MISGSPLLAEAPPPAPGRGGSLHLQVLVAIVAGALVGWLTPAVGAALKPLGDLFIALVKMVIAPVIFLTLVTGIAGLSELGAAGRIALKAFAYFLFFSTLALLLGLAAAHLVQPGRRRRTRRHCSASSSTSCRLRSPRPSPMARFSRRC